MSPEITTLLRRNAELTAALRHEMALTQAAFAPVPATVAPVEVAPVAWQEARAEVESTHGTRLRKFYR